MSHFLPPEGPIHWLRESGENPGRVFSDRVQRALMLQSWHTQCRLVTSVQRHRHVRYPMGLNHYLSLQFLRSSPLVSGSQHLVG